MAALFFPYEDMDFSLVVSVTCLYLSETRHQSLFMCGSLFVYFSRYLHLYATTISNVAFDLFKFLLFYYCIYKFVVLCAEPMNPVKGGGNIHDK